MAADAMKLHAPPCQTDALRLQLAGIRGSLNGLWEVRYRRAAGMAQEWFPTDDLDSAIRFILEASRAGDVYVGAAPRIRRRGKLDDVDQVAVLWADCDGEQARQALRHFSPLPDTVINTGSGENCHAWWSLRTPVTKSEAKRANRRLALALGADMNATDAARVLRAAGTVNHKHEPPKRVEAVYLRIDAYPPTLNDVVGRLPDPKEPAPPTRLTVRYADRGVDPLQDIPATEYVPVLLGRPLGRDNKVTCPFHSGGRERTPSFHCYNDPDDGWACFGCEPTGGRDFLGGDIYTFAARLWEVEIRKGDRSFPDLRRRLATELLNRWEAA